MLVERINQQGHLFDYAETFTGMFGRVRLTRCGITEFGIAAAKKAFQTSMARVVHREETRLSTDQPPEDQ